MRCLPEFTGETGWELSGEGEGGVERSKLWIRSLMFFFDEFYTNFTVGSFRYVNQLGDKSVSRETGQ